MTGTLQSLDNELPTQFFQENVYTSVSLLLKNVSEYLNFFEENVTHLTRTAQNQISSDETSNQLDFIPGSVWHIIFVFAATAISWGLNRISLNSAVIQQWTEAILAWGLAGLCLPFMFFPVLCLLIFRGFLTFFFKYYYDGKLELMNPFDAVWTFESPYSTSTCNGLLVVKGDGDLSRIRNVVLNRLVEKKDTHGNRVYERFRWTFVKMYGFMVWKKDDSNFDLNLHVRYFDGVTQNPDHEWTEEELFREVGRLQDISLVKNEMSPWEMLVVPKFKTSLEKSRGGTENQYAFVIRMHHSIADGISMGNVLHSCFADEPFTFSVDPLSPLKISKIRMILNYTFAMLVTPQITIRNLFNFEMNAFHTERHLTGPKSFNWSQPLQLKAIKEMKNKSNTSVFTVLLSCLAGSMRRLYEKHGYTVPDVIHACPPVAILPYPDRKPRNRFSVVLHHMATGKSDPADRLDAISRASKKLASSPDILANYFAIYILGFLPFFLIKILSPLAHATLTLSNVPGPIEQVIVFDGDELVEIGAWVPIKNRIGIGMTIFSYNDRLRATFIGDQACMASSSDMDLLRDYFETEVQTLAQTLEINNEKLFFQV